MGSSQVWIFLSGIGLFLYGMGRLEHALKKLSTRSFKLFLKRSTRTVFMSLVAGVVLTAILQSSSVVSLLVLAFVGLNLVTFRNALVVILGANVGTTVSSWLVATAGFKLDLVEYAIPVLAVTTLGMFLFERKKKLHSIILIFFSLSVLFIGLGLMKNSALQLVEGVDITAYQSYGALVYVGIGFVLTTIIQSSSATVAITLTAVYANVLTLPLAAAVVVGSEVGTTMKVLFWGASGSVDKRRVAWGNFYYNIFTAVVAYLLLHFIVDVIQNNIGIKDPLIGLVFFQSAINVLAITIFLPFINPLSRLLQRKIVANDQQALYYISKPLPALPEVADEALQAEAEHLLSQALQFYRDVFRTEHKKKNNLLFSFRQLLKDEESTNDRYLRFKRTEGYLLEYFYRFKPEDIGKDEHLMMMQMIRAVRQMVYATKSIKDIQHNLKDFESSEKDELHYHVHHIHEDWVQFEEEFLALRNTRDRDVLYPKLTQAMRGAFEVYDTHHREFIELLRKRKLDELEVSTLMNVEREILACKKSLLKALADIRLEHDQANEFEVSG